MEHCLFELVGFGLLLSQGKAEYSIVSKTEKVMFSQYLCVSVCQSVRATTFEAVNIETSFLVCSIVGTFGPYLVSRSLVKVISMSRSFQDQIVSV